MPRSSRRPGLPWVSAVLVSLLGVALGLPGCRATKELYADTLLAGRTITYDEYLSLDSQADPPPTVDDVVSRLGTPMTVRDRDGVRRRLDYHAFSIDGELKRAEFHFDKEERLSAKTMW